MAETDEFPRPLTPRERETLDFMLTGSQDWLVLLREQANSAKAVGKCTCGCATVHFAVDRHAGNPVETDPTFQIGTDGTAEGEFYSLTLFVEEGWLSSLRISWVDSPPPTFPPISIWEPTGL